MKRNVPIGFRQGEHNDNLKCYIDFKLQGVVVVVLYVHVHYVHVWERLCGLGGKKKMELKNVTMETDGRTNK